MTTDELLEFIDEHSNADDWNNFGSTGVIRHKLTQECPVCFVASEKELNPKGFKESYWEVLPDLHSQEEEILDLINAADGFDNPVRSRLLKACKLV
jgi:hypothetical protein